jgi:hypothetical protein
LARPALLRYPQAARSCEALVYEPDDLERDNRLDANATVSSAGPPGQVVLKLYFDALHYLPRAVRHCGGRMMS